MTSVRAAKAKGSSFEYDCQHSLSKLYPEIWRTSERGFQLQYDLECDNAVFECKRLKSLSWNQAKRYFEKLVENTPKGKTPYLLFKSNRQPCLVMWREVTYCTPFVTEFDELFEVEFQKHSSTRKKK